MNRTKLAIGVFIISLIILFRLSRYEPLAVKQIRETSDIDNTFEPLNKTLTSSSSRNDTLFRSFLDDDRLHPINFDTLNIPLKSFSKLIDRNHLDKKWTPENLKAYFKRNASQRNINLCIWEEQMVSESIYHFNLLNKVEDEIIKMILPPQQRRDQFIIDSFEQPTTYQGKRVNVYNKMERILAYNELENHIQLFLMGYGVIYPTIQILTFSKDEFKYVDSSILYSLKFINDAPYRIKGCLNNSFNEIRIKEIARIRDTLNFHRGHDTIFYKLAISKFGEIEARVEE